MSSFILDTKDEVLTLSAFNSQKFHLLTDIAFGVHPDMRSHADGTFSMGFGATSPSSTKKIELEEFDGSRVDFR